MAKHRSLSSALLTPEKLAFIKGQERTQKGQQPTQMDEEPTQPEPSPEASAEAKTRTRPATNTPPASRPSEASTRPPASAADRTPGESRDTDVSPDQTYRVAVTTRLTSHTADLLRRAYLEQKLNRRRPETQQEIIEAALRDWFRRNGYL